jgi:hypothetical protein
MRDERGTPAGPMAFAHAQTFVQGAAPCVLGRTAGLVVRLSSVTPWSSGVVFAVASLPLPGGLARLRMGCGLW